MCLFAERGRRQSHYAECSWQIRSATLGKIFPARVFPSLPSVVARGARQIIFFKKNKNPSLPTAFARALGTRFFKKNRKTTFADGLCQGRSTENFLKNYKSPPLSKNVNLTPC
jgi:hypothetical protein